MRRLKKNGLSTLKLVHIILASLWMGGALGMILLLTLGLSENNGPQIAAAVQLLDLGMVVPCATGVLVTGLLFSLFTHWGFVKHRWIIGKYVVNLVPVVLGGVLQSRWLATMLGPSGQSAPGAGLTAAFSSARDLFVSFTVLQLALLVVAAYLSTFKPSFRLAAGRGRSLQPE